MTIYTFAETSYVSLVFGAFKELGFPDESRKSSHALRLMIELRESRPEKSDDLCLGSLATMGESLKNQPSDENGYFFMPQTYMVSRRQGMASEYDKATTDFFTNSFSSTEQNYLNQVLTLLSDLNVDEKLHKNFYIEVSITKPVTNKRGKEIYEIQLGHLVKTTNEYGDFYIYVQPEEND